MIPAIRAECRKLLTVRSTYIVTALSLLLVIAVSFWASGYKGGPPSTDLLAQAADNGVSIVPMFLAVIAALLITHEYRYNTIMYSLTASNSRTKVLFAKLLVLIGYGVIGGLLAMVLGAVSAWLGSLAAGYSLPVQYLYFGDMLWQGLFYIIGWVVTGLLFGVLFRHVVGAIVALFIVPSTVEQLLSLVLKDNTKYLPFTALTEVIGQGGPYTLNPAKAALLFSGYLLVGWGVAWYLFVHRDAA